MLHTHRRRGAPLAMLVLVLVGWGAARTLMWEAPRFGGQALHKPPVPARPRAVAGPQPQFRMQQPVPMLGVPAMPQRGASYLQLPQVEAGDEMAPGESAPLAAALAPESAPAAPPPGQLLTTDTAVAHQLLWMAAVASLPLPTSVEQAESGNGLVVRGRRRKWRFAMLDAPGGRLAPAGAVPSAAPVRRWSGDGWLLVRRGGGSLPAGAGLAPTYGANQIGAVLRYRLMAGDRHQTSAYVRGYSALNGTGEREAAFGLSARPLAGLPLIAMAEVRASRFMTGTTHARPAVTLVSALPPVRLGKGIEAETYAAAGYVGGAAATPFIDGQMRVEQVVSRLGSANLRVGVGAWGGAQNGVNRLDVGPTLRLSWFGGHAGVRLAVDWRVRVEGNAQPTSGPALTLSAGF